MTSELYQSIAPLIHRRAPTNQSAYLRQFYNNLLDWLDEGLPKNNIYGFTHRFGLVVNLKFWSRNVFSAYGHAERVAMTEQLTAEMCAQFKMTSLVVSHPFNVDRIAYLAEHNTFTNPLRVFWVRVYTNVPALPVSEPTAQKDAESGFSKLRRKISKFFR